MVGINVPIPVPLAYYTFGGWKRSAFGDLNQHGPDAVRFYTKTKTKTASCRWPSGVKEGASFAQLGRAGSFNIAGPRESEHPGAYDLCLTIIIEALAFQCGKNPAPKPTN
jgi:hypothetical protein